jgi:hypothetical protein
MRIEGKEDHFSLVEGDFPALRALVMVAWVPLCISMQLSLFFFRDEGFSAYLRERGRVK